MAVNVAVGIAAGVVRLNARHGALRRLRGPNVHREACRSDESTTTSTRLVPAEIHRLAYEYMNWRRAVKGVRSSYVVARKRMEAFLHYVARGGYYHQIGRAEGIAKCTAYAYLHEVAEFFQAIAHNYIQMPTPVEFQQLSAPLCDANNPANAGHNVLLYIDGFIVKIQRPDKAGDAYFCGRHGKSCDSINVQYIVDKHGNIRHIITGLSGATHDKTAANWSPELIQFLNQLPDGYVILGDAAYRGLHQKVITPVTGNQLTPQQQQYNSECTRIRQIVERSIGASELKWRLQQLKDNRIAAKKGVVFAAQCTMAAAVLHNRFTNFL